MLFSILFMACPTTPISCPSYPWQIIYKESSSGGLDLWVSSLNNEVYVANVDYKYIGPQYYDKMFLIELLNYDGQRWNKIASATFTTTAPMDTSLTRAIWGSGPADIYIGMINSFTPTVFHYDGTNWQVVPINVPSSSIPPGVYLTAGSYTTSIWGSNRDDVYVLNTLYPFIPSSTTSVLLHYDGVGWSVSTIYHNNSLSGTALTHAYEITTDTVYLFDNSGLFYFTGTGTLIQDPSFQSVSAIWGTVQDGLYVYGTDSNGVSALFHSTTTGWVQLGNPPLSGDFKAYDLWGGSSGDIYLYGQIGTSNTVWTSLFHFDGFIWTTVMDRAPGAFPGSFAITKIQSGDVYGAGYMECYQGNRDSLYDYLVILKKK